MSYVSITNCFFAIALFSAGAPPLANEQQTSPKASNEAPIDQRKMQNEKFGLVIHGGAGTIERSKMTPQKEHEYRAGLERALRAGYEILKRGGSSLDATESAVRVLEDDPHFNAGKGSVFTSAGTNEMDAAIMDGKTLAAGAVAALKHVKNPISLARLVMEKSGHVMMDGEGAEAFARENGIELVDQKYFFTQERWEALQKIKAAEKDRTVPEKQFSLPIKIDMVPWAPLRWTKMEIWPQQLQPAAPQISDRAVSATRRSSARELMPTMRHAPFPQRAMVNILFELQSGIIFRR